MKRRLRRRSPRAPIVFGAVVVVAIVLALAAVAALDTLRQRGVEASLQRPAIDDRSLFISAIAPLARASMEESGVPASVIMGQAIQETGWGSSGLSNWSGNYFGIKCGNARSELQIGCVSRATQEYYDPEVAVTEVADFRSYRTAADSFHDHGLFLRNNPRYAAAFDHTDDPDEFIRAVREAGYATDPNYSESVIRLMTDYDLYRYDEGNPPGTPVQGTFAASYREAGGLEGPLGAPMGPVQSGPIDDTRMIIFDDGMILDSDGEQFTLTGSIWQAYRSESEVRERLGPPLEVTEDTATFEGGTITSVPGGVGEIDLS